jgi:Ca-activated chloride channel family protein
MGLSPCAAIVPCILLGGLALADPAVIRAFQFTSGVSAVEVYATVTDTRGEPVAGLQATDFTILEDGKPQAISTFAAGEFPLALAVGIDRSFSVSAERLTAATSAARKFVEQLRPADQVMVLAVGSDVETVAPLSTDHVAAMTALGRLERWGTTPLYDATLAALDIIQHASGRRALILLSDGEDRYSATTADGLVAQARRRDVLVYPVATGRKRSDLFAELASVTGGRSFQAADRRDLEAALGSIARELRHQYLLGYTPASDERRGWRSIRVTVARPDVKVRSREGYYVR